MKNIFKGTKGKWEACNKTNHVQSRTGHDGRTISGLQTICSVNTVFTSKEESKANAQLISKAPEMLEAMQWFCDRVDNGEVRSTKTYNKFKQIIKEATEI